MSKLCKKFGPFPCDAVKNGEHCEGLNFACIDYVPAGEKTDAINHPDHYTSGGIECIDAIRAILGLKEFADYCKGNVIKYVWRYRHKNGVEDLKKARVYLNWLIEAEEGT